MALVANRVQYLGVAGRDTHVFEDLIMTRQQKGKKGPDSIKDLKSAPLTSGKAESVKGGELSELNQLIMQRQMDSTSKSSDALSNIMKKQSDTSSTIIGNLK